MICFAAIAPHPPIIVPGIGKEEDLKQVKKTILAMERLREDLEKAKPDTVIVISPHAPFDFGSFGINSAPVLAGDLSAFGSGKQLSFENDSNIIQQIKKVSLAENISAHFYKSALDHGALVPLCYLTENIRPKLVHLSFSGLDPVSHYQYGELIGGISADSPKRIAVVASGDLSHRLIPDAPAGYSPAGKKFDRELIGFLEEKKEKEILNFDGGFVEEAGECGLRSIIMLLGTVKTKEWHFDLFSYEGPFGVGYLVGRLV